MASSGRDGEGQRQRDKGKKRKRQSKYLQHDAKRSVISAGVQGFLITCESGKERQSIKEAINLLEQFLEAPTTDGVLGIKDEKITLHLDPTARGTDAENDRPSSSKTEPSSASLDLEAVACDPTSTQQKAALNPGRATNAEDGVDQRGYSSSEETEAELDGEDSGWVKCRRLDESGNSKESCEALEDGAAEQVSDGAAEQVLNGAAEQVLDGVVEQVLDVAAQQLLEGAVDQTSIVKDQENKKPTGESSRGLDELLAAELEDLRDPQKARFIGYETGCHGVIFIRMLPQDGIHKKGPKELAEAILMDAAASKKSRSRFCLRLLPVELTCYASTSEVQKAAEPLISRHFPKTSDQRSFKFAVICESRANTNLNKMDFIHTVAKMVPEPHSVDLKNPDKTIIVQIVKTSCAIGVVQNFKELAKYNLRQLTSPPQEKTAT